jgi:hypothetical protein
MPRSMYSAGSRSTNARTWWWWSSTMSSFIRSCAATMDLGLLLKMSLLAPSWTFRHMELHKLWCLSDQSSSITPCITWSGSCQYQCFCKTRLTESLVETDPTAAACRPPTKISGRSRHSTVFIFFHKLNGFGDISLLPDLLHWVCFRTTTMLDLFYPHR